jgi:superfamily I DNA and/or RNA helicase
VALVGDHNQLKRCVTEPKLFGSNFDRSLMERMALVPGIEKRVLRLNYRSHPSIVRTVLDSIYQGALHAAKEAKDSPPIPGIFWPQHAEERMIFVHVPGPEVKVDGRI